MSEYRSLLEKVGEGIAPPRDSFGRLERRRRRKERRRRVSAGVIALLVAIAGTSAAFLAFRGPGEVRQPAASGLDDFHALWPEQTMAEAQAAQDRLDSGDPGLQWRLTSDAVVSRFARHVLGWEAPFIESCGTFPPDQSCNTQPDTAIWYVHRGCLVCGGVAVEVQRLVRTGETGVWSVTRVGAGVLDIPLEPGAEVQSGQEILVSAGLPDGATVAGGYTYVGACGHATTLVPSLASQGSVAFRVATASFTERCGATNGRSTISGSGPATAAGSSAEPPMGGALTQPVNGYVFAEVLAGLTAAGGFDPFVGGGGSGRQAISNLAAVPVRFVPAAEALPPGQASSPPGGNPTPQPVPSLNASCVPNGTALRLVARGLAFDTDCLAAPARMPFSIELDNPDAATAGGIGVHNLSIYVLTPVGEQAVFTGERSLGPATLTYQVQALEPGVYLFRCDVHPTTMYGALVVK